jgi:hypothetical protein
VFVPGRAYPAASCETADPSVGLSASEYFPGQRRLTVARGFFTSSGRMRLPLVSFLLFSTCQLQGIRLNPQVQLPAVTSGRLERFRLQGFSVPS